MAGTMQAMNTYIAPNTLIDLTAKQVARYSITELVRAAAHEDHATLRFYDECSRAVAEKTGQQASALRSYFVPGDVLQRDLQATAGSGAYLVDTQVMGFGSALYAAGLTTRLPLRRVAAKGNATVATMTAKPTTTWLAGETAELADAAPTFGTVGFTPKTCGTVAWLSRQLVTQSPDGLRFVEQQMAAAVAEARDVAFIQGSGASGQPTGLLTLSGTTSQSGTSLNYAAIAAMIKNAEGYGGGTPHVLMGVTVAELLRQRAKVSGSGPIFDGGSVDGLPTHVSRAVPDDAMLVFDPTLVTEVTWGAMEVAVTPLASPEVFRRGAVGVRIMMTLDYGVDRAASISKSVSIT